MASILADERCGSIMLEVVEDLYRRGLTPDQVRDSLLVAGVGLAVRDGWSVDQVRSHAAALAQIALQLPGIREEG